MSFFFILENNCLQSPESHYLSSNTRTSDHLLFQEKQNKPGIVGET